MTGPARPEKLLERCRICPRRCGVDRRAGEKGYCRAGLLPEVYSHAPHHGEEPVLSGTRGSGTVFFTHCNMKCVYCQNYSFSQLDEGTETSIEKLASIMLDLEGAGCHNINLVNPTHYMPQIVMALERARGAGLRVPIVYNTGGYEAADTIRSLEGLIDIYLPDMRYASDDAAQRYSDSVRYVSHNREAVVEMQRQVGDLALDREGIARKGLIIRLLVLPEEVSGTVETIRFIARHVSKGASVSIMSQYYPTYRAAHYGELSRRITKDEYATVVEEAQGLGLEHGWVQELTDGLNAKFAGTNITPKGRDDG